MRVVDEALKAHLASGATTLARAWVLRRRDGVAMGFTDHDRPLEVDGVTCEPRSGLDAAAVESTTGLAVDNSQAIGALTSAGITDLDIERGLYDGAEVELWLVNWQAPEQRLLQFRGRIGEIRRGDGAFEAELRGLAEALNRPVGRAYLRKCDRVLGDAKCGFDIHAPGFVGEGEVIGFEGRKSVRLSGLEGFSEDWFLHGATEWLSGENAGAQGIVRVDRLEGAERVIELWEETRRAIAMGDRLRVHAGCDKSAATCRHRFANLLNFRGFPHMPGEDWSVAYPVSGTRMDGGSREAT